MNWFTWFLELLAGVFLLRWAIPKLLTFARAVRKVKRNTAIPTYDIGEYTFWLGGGIGAILAVVLAILLPAIKWVNVVLVATLSGGIAAYLVEWLSQQVLPEQHPWRDEVEKLAAQIGVDPGKVRYRLCPQGSPYASPGGVTLPSKALASLDNAALRFTIVGALIARQRGREWMGLIRWLLGGLIAYSIYLVPSLLDRSPPFLSFDPTLPFQIISSLLLVFWARKVPVYVRSEEGFPWDRAALKHTGDLAAACRAIKKTDTPEGASQRVAALEAWWEKYQKELVPVKAGTLGALQPSNSQTQPLNRTP